MERILIVGGSGYVGRFLLGIFRKRGFDAQPTFFRHPEALGSDAILLDVRDREGVFRVLKAISPSVIFQLAYDMEDLEGSVLKGTRNLLEAWAALGRQGRFFYMSTDMVFDGENPPYRESDQPRPLTPYGEAKLKAEAMALGAGAMVLRTSLVYGLEPPDPRTEALKRGLTQGRFDYPYFEDEMRSAVFVEDLCMAMAELAETQRSLPQVLHLAGPRPLSRYELACHLARALGFQPGLVPRARLSQSHLLRPRDLSLDVSLACRLLSFPLRQVEDALGDPGQDSGG